MEGNKPNGTFFGADLFCGSLTAMNAFARTTDVILERQTQALGIMESLTSAWLNSRRKQVESARQMIDQISACQEPAEVARIQQRWLTGLFEQAATELSSVSSNLLSVTAPAVSEQSQPTPHRTAA